MTFGVEPQQNGAQILTVVHGWATRNVFNTCGGAWLSHKRMCLALKAVHGWAKRECVQHLKWCMAEPQENVLST